jgi:archaellum component FlaC
MDERLENIEKRIGLIEIKIDKLILLIEGQSPGIQAMEDHIDLVEEYVRIIPSSRLFRSFLTNLNPIKLLRN